MSHLNVSCLSSRVPLSLSLSLVSLSRAVCLASRDSASVAHSMGAVKYSTTWSTLSQRHHRPHDTCALRRLHDTPLAPEHATHAPSAARGPAPRRERPTAPPSAARGAAGTRHRQGAGDAHRLRAGLSVPGRFPPICDACSQVPRPHLRKKMARVLSNSNDENMDAPNVNT